MRFEGAVANFEAEPSGEFPRGSQALSQFETQLPNSSAHLLGIDRIRLEGVLATHAFLFTIGDHGAFVNAARHGPEVLTLGGTEAFFEPVQAHGPHLGDGVNTVSGELLGTFSTHSPQVGDFSRVKKFLNALGWNDPQPVRFTTGGRHFGEQFIGCHPCGGGQGELLRDAVASALRQSDGVLAVQVGAGEVHEGFIHADLLNVGAQVMKDCHDGAGVVPVVAAQRQDGGVGTEVPGATERHAGAHSVNARLVGGRAYDRAGAQGRHDNGFAAQSGVFEEFDVDEEGVHVQVHNDAAVPYAAILAGSRLPHVASSHSFYARLPKI